MNAFDNLEQRDPAVREASQFSLLSDFLVNCATCGVGWRAHLADHDLTAVRNRAGLAQLPVLRKSDLTSRQSEMPPLGGLSTLDPEKMARFFMSPGPIFEPQGTGQDFWRTSRALYAAGFRQGDIAYNTFSYHLTPGGWILDAGLRALGCAVVPGGVGNTEQQIEAIAHLKPRGFTGVPDYLKVLLDAGLEAGKDMSSLKIALVSGGALFPSLREEYRDRGISVLQAYATADVGVIAYESEALEGMIVDEGVIVEIVKPGTGEPAEDGDVGEVVVTTFNADYPMIRFATGDLSAVLPGTSPCGRTNMRIKGWMGRADQTAKIKGMFVHPSQVHDVSRAHKDVGRVRLVVRRDGEQDVMMLQAEASGDAGLVEQINETLTDVTKLRGHVELVEPGSLPNDGVVIADERDYST